MAVGHFHGVHTEAVGSSAVVEEKNRISARPTRFSAGTKPHSRLSV
jgi:hypothetical protein